MWPKARHPSLSEAPSSHRQEKSSSILLSWLLGKPTMFEITPDDVALLSDEDLRTIIGRLCEAELKKRGLSTSAVTWGGNQNAADGGLDVRVGLPAGTTIDGFVPSPNTGFQAKQMAMPRSEILEEMRPEGVLRPAIRQLADQSGAYIIVSGKDSTSSTALSNRLKAMADAVDDLPNAKALTLDFFDRTRVATWLRDHAGLIPWVREKIGKAIQGWQSYGAWAYSPDGVSDEYLIDSHLRIRTDAEVNEDGLSALEGIERIRDQLRKPRRVTRLVGLSGVGKTRLVQALFDGRVGKDSLDPSLVYYTNIADEPNPTPATLASDLIAARERAILVVDNCPPDLHHRLSEVCRSPESTISLTTIEYDIREDLPEGTEVFSLEPSSIDLIEKLIRRRFAHLSPIDARTIAEFSGGNARIAIALAETIGRNETVAGLSDEDLFQRLFRQRQEPDEALLAAAEALSLVYSFHGVNTSLDNEAELFRLGTLVGKSPQDMFRAAAELHRRGLIQKRGPWRALLPHAIANRLATRALQNIAHSEIEARLTNGAPERLVKSFSRRLGFLIGSREAEEIVKQWLGPSGLLENVIDLNELGLAMFRHVAPVAPEAALSALERALLNCESHETVARSARYLHLLRSIAYDAGLFERCSALIVKIAEAQDAEKRQDEGSRAFASLFPIYFSGTHATLEQRLAVITSLVRSEDPKKNSLGISALTAALEATHFGPGFNFEFGARPRDYGYWPRTREDIKGWFALTINTAQILACSEAPAASHVRAAIAEQFRGLWTSVAAYDELERVCNAISKVCFWSEGWLAVRQTMYYDSNGFSPVVSARLASLEELLRPKNVVEKVRSIVLDESVIHAGLDSTYDGGNNIERTIAQVHAVARELGKDTACDQESLTKLAQELIAGNSEQLWFFGRGLAEGSTEPRETWRQLLSHLSAAPTDRKNPHVFRGFLNGLHETNANLANDLLDEALENVMLVKWYPALQTAVGVDKRGVDRLMRSLELHKTWIGMYRNLVFGGATHCVSGKDFNNLLSRIAKEPEGVDVAIEILCMRLSSDEGRCQSSASEIIQIGCELMGQITFAGRRNVRENYSLQLVARNCLVGEKGATTVREICRKLRESVSKSETYAFHHSELLQALLSAQPLAALEGICGDDHESLTIGLNIMDQSSQLRRNALDSVPEAELLGWCDQQPAARYPAAAAAVTPFQPGDEGRPQWTSTARKLLDRAPDRVSVLKRFVDQFIPASSVGSQAAILENNRRLLDDLAGYPDKTIAEFIAGQRTRIAEVIKTHVDIENVMQRDRDERFEY